MFYGPKNQRKSKKEVTSGELRNDKKATPFRRALLNLIIRKIYIDVEGKL